MRYQCYVCGAGGASSTLNAGPASYHCHQCQGRSTMVPLEHLDAYKALVELKAIKARQPDSGAISGEDAMLVDTLADIAAHRGAV